MAEVNASLRERVLDALTSEGPDVLRIVNAGTLEDELWTDANWRDEYADVLAVELAAMVEDGLLSTTDVWGMTTYSIAQPLSEHPGADHDAQDRSCKPQKPSRESGG